MVRDMLLIVKRGLVPEADLRGLREFVKSVTAGFEIKVELTSNDFLLGSMTAIKNSTIEEVT